mgnify:CR=1 FL=1
MKISGRIHTIDIKNKLVGILINKKIQFYYFQNSQMNLFKRYLYVGNWVEIEYDENHKIIKGKKEAFVVSFVYKISSIDKYNKIIYYDKKMLNTSLSNFLKSLGNIMVLDLEMTMPSYNFKGKGFKAEIIQAGYMIINGEGEEITRYSKYIKPKLQPKLSKRAEDFLKLDFFEFEANAISYDEFYEEFSEALDIYKPVILVYGKNDIIVLNDSYTINDKPSLSYKTRFINLCQLIKNYYDLRNDPGLFKLYKIYYDNQDIQIHDAFNDSEVTALVFKAFKDEVNLKTNKVGCIRKELE